MKKIATIFLIFAGLLQSGGLFIFYEWQQYEAIQEMAMELTEHDAHFQKLILTKGEFEKYRIDDHEISFNGKMYDVKSIQVSGNSVELIVIHDAKEESALEKIKDLSDSSGNPRHSGHAQLMNYLTLTFITPEQHEPVFFQQAVIWHFNIEAEDVIVQQGEIPSPPPRIA